MQIIFLNVRTQESLTMPVTPPAFRVERGRLVEGLDMASVGPLNLPGLPTLFNEQLEFLLPAEPRNYTSAGYSGDPYAIVDKLAAWSEAGDVLRLIVTETPVNLPILLAPVRYGEQDGTGDVYVTLTMQQYRELTAVETEKADTQNASRPTPAEEKQETSYTVVKGDTLWGICRRTYGQGNLAYKLAAYNGIKNANLIRIGQVIRLPDRSVL